MAYKYSVGGRKFNDITAETDSDGDTKIDFEEDYISFQTNGADVLVVSGSNVGIGTTTPSDTLTIEDDQPCIQFKELNSSRAKIFINNSDNLVIQQQTTNKHIVFKVLDQGVVREGIRLNGTVPEVVVNEQSDSLVDFRVESNDNTHMLYVDGGENKIGINTDQPTGVLDINADAIRLRIDNTPSSASDFGHKGEIRWDANYIYICVATDTWKRVALSSW
jgi:hypothetical protein